MPTLFVVVDRKTKRAGKPGEYASLCRQVRAARNPNLVIRRYHAA